MTKAAPMHDIGKISTPDFILQKPGKLTEEEIPLSARIMVISDVFDAVSAIDLQNK